MIPGVLYEYIPKSWFHPKGIYKVVADILPRLPDVSGSLFLTFTVNPLLFSCPESAFDYSRGQLRKLFFELRNGVEWEGKTYKMDAPYCVKVEFHRSGWAHFHVIFLTKRFLPGGLLNELWGIGRTNVKRITNEDFHYLLKYVCKSGDIPEWVLRRKRIRIFQTSRGFYAVPRKKYAKKEEEVEEDGEGEEQEPEKTIGERIESWAHKATFKDEADHFRQVLLKIPFREMLGEIVLVLARLGLYLGRGKIQLNKPEHVACLTTYIENNEKRKSENRRERLLPSGSGRFQYC